MEPSPAQPTYRRISAGDVRHAKRALALGASLATASKLICCKPRELDLALWNNLGARW